MLHEGDRLSLELGSAGKVLLAFGKNPPKALARIRTAFIAMTHGERDPDAASVSVPVFSRGAVLEGALSLSGPADRFDDRKNRAYARLLLTNAAGLTERLGGDAGSLHRARDRVPAR